MRNRVRAALFAKETWSSSLTANELSRRETQNESREKKKKKKSKSHSLFFLFSTHVLPAKRV